jgi:redox-sensitive bicupin YhaK (pirin superfamily)
VKYEVRLVDDDALPDGRDLVIVERGPAECAVMLLAGRPAQIWRAVREWEAAHNIPESPIVLHAVS